MVGLSVDVVVALMGGAIAGCAVRLAVAKADDAR